MSLIRSRDTRPETIVRSLLQRLGYRFRIHVKNLPGKPDIVLPKFKSAIFVHGCFWHRHKGCKRCTTPTSNTAYWIPKLEGNAQRDKAHIKALRKLGWKVFVVWECEIKNIQRVRAKLQKFLDGEASKITNV